VEAAAREQDLNLLAFPGGAIWSEQRRQANIIYELITPEAFAGLITWVSFSQRLASQAVAWNEEEPHAL